jgi:hypothetical protein
MKYHASPGPEQKIKDGRRRCLCLCIVYNEKKEIKLNNEMSDAKLPLINGGTLVSTWGKIDKWQMFSK